MAAQALGDGVGDHRGDDLAELGVAERQLDLGGVELCSRGHGRPSRRRACG